MMNDRELLAAYQAGLLECLYQPKSAEEIRSEIDKLAGNHAPEKDLRMIDVAAVLVKKWGVRVSGD